MCKIFRLNSVALYSISITQSAIKEYTQNKRKQKYFFKNPLPGGWETFGRRAIANIGIPIDVFFAVSMIFLVLTFFLVFGSLQTSLLCLVGDLAGRESVTVANGVSDR